MASEIGADLSRFATVKQFFVWLGLAPPTKISVDKNLPGNSHRVNKRVGQAIRQAAVNACRSENFIKDNPPGLSWLWRQPSFTAGTHGYGEIGHVNG